MSENIVAIYVETPYQLFTSINIAKQYLNADGCMLFIMKKQYLTHREFTVTADHSFIKGIYYIQDYEEVGAFRHHIRRIKGILSGFPSKEYPNMLSYYITKPKKMPEFSAIICNKYEILYARYYSELYHRNPNIYVIEDGTGDYVNPPNNIPESYKRIYYWPELFFKNFSLKAYQAPKISLNDIEMREIIRSIYGLNKEDVEQIKKCKCVYFHQPNDNINKKTNNCDDSTELIILSMLKKKFGDSFFVKLHPRDDLSILPEYSKINSNIPWEVLLYGIDDISHLLMVGFHSTTLFSSKNTFNLEPYVISTMNLLKFTKSAISSSTQERLTAMFDYMKKQYSDSSKVIIPSSIDELNCVLNIL